VAIVLSAGMVLAIGQGMKLVIDEGFARGQEQLLDQTLGALAALVGLLGVLTWFRVYNVYWIGARFTADLRRRVYDHLLTLSPGFYESARTGEVSSRVTNDVTLIEAVMGGTLLYALRMAITLAGCVVMLFFTSVKLTALALVCMPLVLLPIGLLGTRVRKLSRAVQDRVADVSAHVDETLHEIRTVQAFAHEDRESATFGERVEAVFLAAVQRSHYLAALIAAVIVLAFGAVGVLLWVGAHDVFEGRHQLVVLLCDEGCSTQLAVVSLLDLGLVGATDVIGGMQAWLADGLPSAPPDTCVDRTEPQAGETGMPGSTARL